MVISLYLRNAHIHTFSCRLIQVKVDDKTKAMLEEYEKSHVTEESDVKREDRLALAALDAVMREFAAELRRNAPREQPSIRHPREAYGVNVSGPKADEVCISF